VLCYVFSLPLRESHLFVFNNFCNAKSLGCLQSYFRLQFLQFLYVFAARLGFFFITIRIISLSRQVFDLYAFYSQSALSGKIIPEVRVYSSHLTSSIPQGQRVKLCSTPRNLILVFRVAISSINPGMKSYGTRTLSLDLFEFALRYHCSVTRIQSNF